MAANTDPVNIVVNIVDEFSDELKELEAKLDKLDAKKITVDFEIDSEGEIKKVKAQLQELKKEINTDLDINVDGAGKAEATKQALSRDMSSTLHINTDKRGAPALLGTDPREAVKRSSRGSIRRALPNDMPPWSIPDDVHPHRMDSLVDMETGPGEFMRSVQHTTAQSRKIRGPDVMPLHSNVGKFFEGRMGAPQIPRTADVFGGTDPLMGPRALANKGFDPETFGETSRRRLKKLGQALDKLRPNIMMVWNALAALIPILVTLAAAAIGLAGAMIAVATAGAAIIGLGLLGWGEDFQSNLQNLQKEARALGSQLFDVAQPLARAAQPILRDWMEGTPRQVQKLVSPLRELMFAYDDTLGQVGSGIVDWVGRVIQSMTAMQGVISQITLRFGGVAGDFMIDFMENMIVFAHRNQDALIRTSHALRNLLGVLLDVSIVIVRVLNILEPLTGALKWLSGIISNRFVAAAIAMIGTFIVLQTALTSVTSMSAAMGAGLLGVIKNAIVPYITAVRTAIAETWAWIKSLGVLRGALASIGIGLLVVGAGAIAAEGMSGPPTSPPSGSGRTAGSGGTVIQIDGNVEKKQMDRLLDEVPAEARNESEFNSEMSR